MVCPVDIPDKLSSTDEGIEAFPSIVILLTGDSFKLLVDNSCPNSQVVKDPVVPDRVVNACAPDQVFPPVKFAFVFNCVCIGDVTPASLEISVHVTGPIVVPDGKVALPDAVRENDPIVCIDARPPDRVPLTDKSPPTCCCPEKLLPPDNLAQSLNRLFAVILPVDSGAPFEIGIMAVLSIDTNSGS